MDTKNPNAINFSSFFAICSSGNLESHAQTFGPLLPWWPLSLGRKQPILPALKETAVQGERRFNQSNWMLFRINSNHLCLHNFGEESCSVTMPRPFKFQTGRADCVEVDLSIHPSRGIYSNKLSWSLDQGRKKDPSLKCISQQTKSITLDPFFPRETRSLGTRRPRPRFTQTPLETAAPQSSSSATPLPWRGGRCCSADFQLQSFFNLNKVVALMGAHTFGKPHFEISMFPYTWTRS